MQKNNLNNPGKRTSATTLALAGGLALAGISMPALPLNAAEPGSAVIGEMELLAISKEQTLQNLSRLESNAKKYGTFQAQQLQRYLEKLKDVLEKNPAQLSKISNDSSHPLYDVANHAIGSAYYDRLFVYESLHLRDPDGPWKDYANDAARIWVTFIEVSGGTLAGRWTFPHGLHMHYERTKGTYAIDAFEKMVKNSHYVRDNFPDTSSWATSDSALRSREVAYGLKTQLVWDKIQKKKNPAHSSSPRIHKLADYALGHIDQWFNEDSTWKVPYEGGELLGSDVRYVRPFMVALTVQSLLEYHEHYKASTNADIKKRLTKIKDAAVLALESIWKSSWNESRRAFTYTDRDLPRENRDYDEIGRTPQPDLNMLFAPVYYRLAKLSPDTRVAGNSLLECSDLILDGAIRGTEEWGWKSNKQFNQQFFHDVFSYIDARRKELQ